MSEQGPPFEDSPVVAGPDGTGEADENSQGATDIDWQKRYVDTQEAYTRGQQELAELRRQQELYDLMVSTDDPDTQRAAALELGYVYDDEDTQQPDDDDDPTARQGERIDRLETALSEREQAELEAEQLAEMTELVDQQLDALDMDKADQDWVLAYAVNALPATDEGLPDIRQAYEQFQARETERQRNWAKSKQAPRISPHGQPATEVPNLDDRQQRHEYMVRRLMEGEQAGY